MPDFLAVNFCSSAAGTDKMGPAFDPSLSTSPFPYPGKVFDSKGYYAGYVPASLGATVVHVVFIQAWNKIYRKVATRLTERENHRTEEV